MTRRAHLSTYVVFHLSSISRLDVIRYSTRRNKRKDLDVDFVFQQTRRRKKTNNEKEISQEIIIMQMTNAENDIFQVSVCRSISFMQMTFHLIDNIEENEGKIGATKKNNEISNHLPTIDQ